MSSELFLNNWQRRIHNDKGNVLKVERLWTETEILAKKIKHFLVINALKAMHTTKEVKPIEDPCGEH